MSDITRSSEDLKNAVKRFDKSLSRLELSLGSAVEKIAKLGHSTGYADAVANLEKENYSDNDANNYGLQQKLDDAKLREQELESAVNNARTALSEAIDDIKSVLGPL